MEGRVHRVGVHRRREELQAAPHHLDGEAGHEGQVKLDDGGSVHYEGFEFPEMMGEQPG